MAAGLCGAWTLRDLKRIQAVTVNLQGPQWAGAIPTGVRETCPRRFFDETVQEWRLVWRFVRQAIRVPQSFIS